MVKEHGVDEYEQEQKQKQKQKQKHKHQHQHQHMHRTIARKPTMRGQVNSAYRILGSPITNSSSNTINSASKSASKAVPKARFACRTCNMHFDSRNHLFTHPSANVNTSPLALLLPLPPLVVPPQSTMNLAVTTAYVAVNWISHGGAVHMAQGVGIFVGGSDLANFR